MEKIVCLFVSGSKVKGQKNKKRTNQPGVGEIRQGWVEMGEMGSGWVKQVEIGFGWGEIGCGWWKWVKQGQYGRRNIKIIRRWKRESLQ